MSTQVVWIPGHPSNGSVSMDRYWREIHQLFQRGDFPEVSITCPLASPPPGWPWQRKSRAERVWHKYLSYPWAIRRHPPGDVTHMLEQGYAHLFRSVASRSFKIATVHDLVAIHPEYSGLPRHQMERSRRIFAHLQAADLLIADSEFTARDILDHFRIHPSRITVLPLGVDHERFEHSRTFGDSRLSRLGACPKVLSVGSLDLRKNNDILPEVIESLVARIPDVALLRVGPALTSELADCIRVLLRPGHFLELGKLSDENLAAAYQASDVYFFPSLWEGFGLPVLEAMAAGIPVVCSDASSLPEVGGSAAHYFEPRDAEHAADQILKLLTDRQMWERSRQEGIERARRYSWTRHVEALNRIYLTRDRLESAQAPAAVIG